MNGLIIKDADLETAYVGGLVQAIGGATTAAVLMHTYLEESDPSAAVTTTLIMVLTLTIVYLAGAGMIKTGFAEAKR